MTDNTGFTSGGLQGQGYTDQQFVEGTDVYDVNGDRVGTVSEHGVQQGALVIHHGLLRRDVYIPLGVIARNDVDGVYLTIDKDQALNEDWSGVSDQQGTITTGTMATDTLVTGTVTGAAGVATGNTVTTDQQDIRVPVVEEELVVGKRAEEQGRVHIHKDVVTEQESIPVTLQREQVVVERVPLQGQAGVDTTDAFTGQDIEVPVMGEQAVVGKEVHVAEEVRLRKEAVTEQQQVSDTVRKERVYVEGAEDVSATTGQVVQGQTYGTTGTSAYDTGTTGTNTSTDTTSTTGS